MTPPTSLSKALAALKAARCPEDVFGAAPDGLKDGYRDWAKRCHPDNNLRAKKAAEEAFALLTKVYAEAEAKVKRGCYGDLKPSTLATFRTKTASYAVTHKVGATDIADLYEGASDKGTPVLVKVCRAPLNSDLMKVEADILAALPAALDPKHTAYFPNLLDSFEAALAGNIKVRVNVFSAMEGMVSLAAVRKAYPAGLDPKDAAWMWNRMLEALHLLHVEGWIHANVTPDAFLIHPDTHAGCLVDLCYAIKAGSKAKAISPPWKQLYPSELLAKQPLDYSADVFMAAHCMAHLLGAETGSAKLPKGTPIAIAGLLWGCWLGKAHRTAAAKDLHASFKEVRKGLGWPKGFRPFTMPTAASVHSV